MKVKKFSHEDVPMRVRWINNSRINLNMFFELPATIEKTENWCARIQSDSSRIDLVFKEANGEYLAMGGFTAISDCDKNAEFYIMVNPNLQGRGFGKIASRWMFNYGFSVLRLNRIYLYTNDSNVIAYKIYEDSGFKLEGILREHKYKNGMLQNRRLYGLLKSEWENFLWNQNVENEI